MGKEIEPQKSPRVCCILGTGDILDYDAVRSSIPTGAFVICADGGYRHCKGLGIVPGLLMGDFDSIGEQLPGDIPHITLPADKDYSDTAFAVEKAVEDGYTRLILAGMLGGRLDHTVANLQTLGHCATMGLDACITDGVTLVHGVYAPADDATEFVMEPRKGCYFSLLSLSDACQSVTINGGVYPLNRYPLGSLDPRAISNEFAGGPVTVTLRGGVILVMITPMDR